MAKRARQQVLPDSDFIQALDDAVMTYEEAKDARLPLTLAEKEAKENLILKMQEAGRTHYVSADGIVADVTESRNVRTRRKDAKDNEEAEDDG